MKNKKTKMLADELPLSGLQRYVRDICVGSDKDWKKEYKKIEVSAKKYNKKHPIQFTKTLFSAEHEIYIEKRQGEDWRFRDTKRWTYADALAYNSGWYKYIDFEKVCGFEYDDKEKAAETIEKIKEIMKQE